MKRYFVTCNGRNSLGEPAKLIFKEESFDAWMDRVEWCKRQGYSRVVFWSE